MSGVNSQMSLVGLDFDTIKNNLRTFLQSQDTFKDYNFEGSALSVLLDILSYNTQYNAFYLNMVANESFFDTALQRSSVVSHAKLLNYTPQSAISPVAYINISASGVSSNSLTIPAGTIFLSEALDGINYNFFSTESVTGIANNNIVTINNLEIKQGLELNYNFTVNTTTNPSLVFEIPDDNIDTSTIRITVQKSSSNTYYDIYTEADDYLTLDGDSQIFFVEESLTGRYQVSFGNGVIGKKLTDGNIVKIYCVSTSGSSSIGANNFSVMRGFGTTNLIVEGSIPCSQGSDKEDIDSIKFQAPKSYSSQKRAVSKNDYITIVQQNKIGLTFDAVNVWGGEDNVPPVYGKIFMCLKPKGAYTITETQKEKLINDVIKPISVLTVQPTILDPDYTYLLINSDVVYDQKKTVLNSSQIADLLKTNISNYTANNLNTFNSTISSTDIGINIKNSDKSIITSDVNIKLQKKIYPNLNSKTSYNLYFNTPLEKGTFLSGISSNPGFQILDEITSKLIDGIYFEEVPSATNGVDTITIINPGYSYQQTPTVNILGDGSGATARAILVNGKISRIDVLTPGENYSSAIVQIVPSAYDTTGTGAAAAVNFQGKYGTLRTYYYNDRKVKTILNSNAGSIDYVNGIVSLIDFNPYNINNVLGQLSITVTPKTSIIESSFNTIITSDVFDPNAIVVNASSK